MAAALLDSICVLSEGLAGLARSETRRHRSLCHCLPVRHRGPIVRYSQWLSTTGLRSIEALVVIKKLPTARRRLAEAVHDWIKIH